MRNLLNVSQLEVIKLEEVEKRKSIFLAISKLNALTGSWLSQENLTILAEECCNDFEVDEVKKACESLKRSFDRITYAAIADEIKYFREQRRCEKERQNLVAETPVNEEKVRALWDMIYDVFEKQRKKEEAEERARAEQRQKEREDFLQKKNEALEKLKSE